MKPAIRFQKHSGPRLDTAGLLAVELARLAAEGVWVGSRWLVDRAYRAAQSQCHWLP